MTTNVRVGLKLYKNLESLTIGKLEHILQLADIDITNYKQCIKNYPIIRMVRFGQPYLDRLVATREVIQDVVNIKNINPSKK